VVITSSVSPLVLDFGAEAGGLAVQGRACAVQPGRLHRWRVLDVGPRVVLGEVLGWSSVQAAAWAVRPGS